MSRELAKRGKGSLNLGSGVWYDLNETVRCNRNIFAHSGVESAEKSFPPFSIAENAIKWIRNAIQEIYALTSKDCPRWVNADHVGGWPERRGVASTLTVGEVEANLDSQDLIKLILVREDGKEDFYRYFSPDTPNAVLDAWGENLLGGERFNLSYAKIRIYHGSDFVDHDFEAR